MTLEELLVESARRLRAGERLLPGPMVTDGGVTWCTGPHMHPLPFPGDWDTATDVEIAKWYQKANHELDEAAFEVRGTKQLQNGQAAISQSVVTVEYVEDQASTAANLLRKDAAKVFADLDVESKYGT